MRGRGSEEGGRRGGGLSGGLYMQEESRGGEK